MSGLSTLSGAPALGRRADTSNSSSLTGGLLPLGGKTKPPSTTSDLDELLNIIDDDGPRSKSKSSKSEKTDGKSSSKSKSRSKEGKGKGKSKKSITKAKSGDSVKSGSEDEIVVSDEELEDVVLNAQPSRVASRPSTSSNSTTVADAPPFADSSQALLKPTGFSFKKENSNTSSSRTFGDTLGPASSPQAQAARERAGPGSPLWCRRRPAAAQGPAVRGLGPSKLESRLGREGAAADTELSDAGRRLGLPPGGARQPA